MGRKRLSIEEIKDKKWHVDHIFPVAAFLEYGITDYSIICALDNLQPLPAKENLQKQDYYNRESFENYLVTKQILTREAIQQLKDNNIYDT